MADVKVKTLRGFVPIGEIGTNDYLKAINEDGILEYKKVAKVVRMPKDTTFKVGNQNRNLYGWYNVDDEMEVVVSDGKKWFSIFNIVQSYVSFPTNVFIGYSGKKVACELQPSQIKEDVRKKDIRSIYYDESSTCSLLFIQEWVKQYGSLVADDYHLATLLNTVVSNTRLSGYITREDKFVVKVVDESNLLITNCNPTEEVKMNLAFIDNEGKTIRALYTYEGQCFIR